MPVMRGVYLITETNRRLKGSHSHAPNGIYPLCKLDKRQLGKQQQFLRWEYEESDYFTCPACRKIARNSQEQRILQMFGRDAV